MKIGVFPADLEACGHYRLIWPAMTLKDEGMDITIVPPHDRGQAFTATIENDTVTNVTVPDYDIFVFQRVTHKYLAQAIKLIRMMGRGVIVDIDDDLDCIHPSNPAWAALHPKKNVGTPAADHSWEWCRLACSNATMVTVSSPALYDRYVTHGRGRVLRNYIPEHYLTIERKPSNIVGWGGSYHSHADDVPMLGTSIVRLEAEGHRFKVVGNGVSMQKALRMQGPPDITGQVDLDQWPNQLATLGIGVAPLADTRFNEAKSWLKPLEYASVGVPCVMSPRAEYKEIKKLGIGLLAQTSSDWFRQLKKLVEYDAQREDLALASREIAATMTIQRKIDQWASVIIETDSYRKRMRRGDVSPGIAFGLNRPRQSAR